MEEKKLTSGPNDSPSGASIGQTAGGFPDDSGRAVDVDSEKIEATRQRLVDEPHKKLAREVKEQEEASRLGSE
ncbi:hypothetical protein [Agrobacterium sp. CG674]|jgi:hypothetical protein